MDAPFRTLAVTRAAARFCALRGWAPVEQVTLPDGRRADILALLKKHFRTVKHAKPPASRKGSSEWYVIAQGFKGGE